MRCGPLVSCSFHWLDYLFPNVPMDLESVIVQSKSILLRNVPAGEALLHLSTLELQSY